jgi:hypothetical protein
MGSGWAALHYCGRQECSRTTPAGQPARCDRYTDVGRAREGQREASLNLIDAIIPPWRGVPDATSADRKSRSLDRCTRNRPCSRMAILGWPSQSTRLIRAGRRTPVRAPPSAQRFRSIRCARPTRRHLVRIHRKWRPAVLRLQGQRRGRWIMRLPSGLAPGGLPVGVQIAGPQYGDRTCIAFARSLEGGVPGLRPATGLRVNRRRAYPRCAAGRRAS